MSDTQAKIDKRKEEARAVKKKNQKRASGSIKYTTKKKIRNIAITVVACVLALAVIVPNLSFAKRAVTAARIGDTRISTAEFSYAYISSFYNYYNTMASYVGQQYIGISTAKSLRKQNMSSTQTYSEYFCNTALQSLQQMIVLSEEAEKNGFTLSEKQQKEYEDALETMKTTAEKAGLSVDRYLRRMYGQGVNRVLYEKMLYRLTLASAYQEKITNNFEYTQKDLEDYYKENTKSFDRLTLRYQKFAIVEATETAAGVTAEEAKKQAEAFMSKVKDDASFSAAALKLAKENASDPDKVTTENTLKTDTTYATIKNANEALADWALDASRKEGDLALIDGGEKVGYYVAYMITPAHREEYNTVDMRHILVSLSSTDAKDETKKAEAKAKAEKLLKEWKDGAATEESFAELADKNSDDKTAGGLYEKVYHDAMVEEVNDWLFNPKRKAGDCEIVYSENYGYHIIYYVGENVPYWQVRVESTMRNNDYNDFYEKASENYPVTTSKFGIWYRNEPF